MPTLSLRHTHCVGWRFQRRKTILPGVRMNLGKRGPSLSLGGRGVTTNIGRRGVGVTLTLLGTGLSYLFRQRR